MKKVLSLMSFLLVQCSLFASEPIDLHGCWSVSHYIAYNCVTEEDSIPHIADMYAHGYQHFFFDENGKGFRVYPSNDVDEFKWSVSNDTLNILDGDTLVPYRIENVKTRGLHRSIFLRLLSEGTRNFHESFYPFSIIEKSADYVFSPEIPRFDISKKVQNAIGKIEGLPISDLYMLLVGYGAKDGKFHFTYPQTSCLDKDFRDDILTEGDFKCVLLVLYDEKMRSVRKLALRFFVYTPYLSEHVYISVAEDYKTNGKKINYR